MAVTFWREEMDLTRAALRKYRSKPDQQTLIFRRVTFLKHLGLERRPVATAEAAYREARNWGR